MSQCQTPKVPCSALEKLKNDPTIDNLICSMFQDLEVSDMANYWINFMSMVEVLMMNVHACTHM